MKKYGVMAAVACMVLTMAGCGGKTEKVPFDNGDSLVAVNADPTLYGICGDGSTMNTLQLYTDNGDTLNIDISEAQENNQVFGGIQTGDRMAVLPAEDRSMAIQVVNQTALLGNWVMPNPLDGSDEVGISIKEGGIVESIEQSSIIYKTWRFTRGKLEMVLVREGGSEEEETYAYDLVLLGADTLVYKLNTPDEQDVYEYSRQKPKKGYGTNIQLEDAEKEFFL